jgi:hypothetical protein
MTEQQYSPSTQAVSDAVKQVYWDWGNLCPASADTIAAAALRAAVDAVVPEYREHSIHCLDERHRKVSAFNIRDAFLSIINELEETYD